jgi:apolipoprotein D and lipocalin family protein
VLALLGFAVLGCTDGEPAVAEGLSLERFEGRWYEIARIPRDYDRTCHDTTAEYRLTGPGHLEMTHRCHLVTTDGKLSEFRAPAAAGDARVPAKLTLDLGYFYGDYWVLAVGKNYEDALIGHPSLTMLWVLSRSPTLAPERYEELTALATRQGYGVGMLELTPQSGKN